MRINSGGREIRLTVIEIIELICVGLFSESYFWCIRQPSHAIVDVRVGKCVLT
jgi:hypothetical protein